MSNHQLHFFSLLLVTLLTHLNPLYAVSYPVTGFDLKYAGDYSEAPPLESLETITVTLQNFEGAWTSVQHIENGQVSELPLGQLPENTLITAEGIQTVLEVIVKKLNAQDYHSVYVVPSPADIHPRTGEDKRAAGDLRLELDVYLGVVTRTRTVAKGKRFAAEDPINNPHHRRILEHSPIAESGVAGGNASSLLRKGLLDDYLRRINRHPGKRVDASIASSGEPGSLYVDYLVTENRPYTVYFQVSNTGTESTGEWRERFGFVHYQLTGHDDVFSADFITAEFDQSNAFLASYQIPLLYPDYLKARIYGSWSEYRADEVGVSKTEFKGQTYTGGIELLGSPVSLADFGIDLVAGVRFTNIKIDSTIGGSSLNEGEAEIVVPYIGTKWERRDGLSSSEIRLFYEWNAAPIDENVLDDLGRLNVARDWSLIRGYATQSWFWEPIVLGDKWRNSGEWQDATLAHETRVKLSGQYVFGDDRVISQETFVLGGAYSVRGYPESVTSSDNGFFASAEYLFHLPRMLKPYSAFTERPSRFMDRYNLRPPQPLTFPDWDLMFKGFVDFGATSINQAELNEVNPTLLSTGVGVELQLLSYFNIRCDYGYILKSVRNFNGVVDDADEGDSRLHLIATFSW